MRLKDKIAIVVGAGQGREPAWARAGDRHRFVQEGAKVLCVDKDFKSARKPLRWRRKKPRAAAAPRPSRPT